MSELSYAEVGVVAGHDVIVTVVYVPDADVPLQEDGTVSPEEDPHDAGTLPARRSAAVRRAA